MCKYPLILSLLIIQQIAFAQKSSDIPYQFPIRPGTESWAKFKNGQEMIDATQVPNQLLSKLTTQALVLTCLDYPRLINIYAFNNIQTGTERLVSQFNGLAELLTRQNSGPEILKIYQLLNPGDAAKSAVLEEQGQIAFKFTIIEMLLAQKSVINTFSEPDKKKLIEEGLKKFKEKEALLDIYGGLGLTTTALVMGRVLEKHHLLNSVSIGSEEEHVQRAFLDKVEVIDANIILEIIDKAQVFVR